MSLPDGSKEFVEEVPAYVKQLAILIGKGFYQMEDSLIIDMLVRNSCMSEKDLEFILKFDQGLLRQRLDFLKKDLIIKQRTKLVKSSTRSRNYQKLRYYFISYKSLVNMVKYKLDRVRKSFESVADNSLRRPFLVCKTCPRNFNELQISDVFDIRLREFRCTFCRSLLEEHEESAAMIDRRNMVARFNDQMKVIYDILKKADGVVLPEVFLEPFPETDFEAEEEVEKLLKKMKLKDGKSNNSKEDGKSKSSEENESPAVDEMPMSHEEDKPPPPKRPKEGEKPKSPEVDEMLMSHEEDEMPKNLKEDGKSKRPEEVGRSKSPEPEEEVEIMNTSDEEEESESDVDVKEEAQEPVYFGEGMPMVRVGNNEYPIIEVDDSLIRRMTNEEQDDYSALFQSYYGFDFELQ